MQYKIIDNPSYSNVYTVGLELEPDAKAVKLFFSSVKLDKYPEMIKGVLKDEGYYGEISGVLFHSDLDAEDIADGNVFEPHQVKLFNHYFGEEIVEASFFKSLLLDFGTKLLDRYAEEVEEKGVTVQFQNQLKLLGSQLETKP